MANVKYPKYVITADGNIGVFSCLEYGIFPVYRFGGGYRVADHYELKNGSDDREELIRNFAK